MRLVPFLCAATLIGTLAPPLEAQVFVQRANPGGGLAFDLSSGEPISFFLEHSRELELTEVQRTALMNIRRRLRQTNAPFMHELDSLRESLGISMEPRPRLSPGELEAFARFKQISQPVTDSIRANNQVAQEEARQLLGEQQRTRLDSLVTTQRNGAAGRGRRGSRPPP